MQPSNVEQLTLGTDKRNYEDKRREQLDSVFIDRRLIVKSSMQMSVLLITKFWRCDGLMVGVPESGAGDWLGRFPGEIVLCSWVR